MGSVSSGQFSQLHPPLPPSAIGLGSDNGAACANPEEMNTGNGLGSGLFHDSVLPKLTLSKATETMMRRQ